MTRAVPLKVFVVVAVSFAIASIPESSFAQRGGGGVHGGGGGFHGGGFGGGGFHGGGFGGGGFHGGGFGGGSSFHSGGFGGGGFRGGGFHNGFGNGFNGGFHHGFGGGFGFPGWWGWGGWGWGWGLDIGFGWPYWGWGYPYYYDYGPYAYGYPYEPYYYPDYHDYAPDRRYDYRNAPDNRAPENREPDYRHDNSKPNDQIAPAKPSNTPVPGDSRGQNSVTRNYGPTNGVSRTPTTPATGTNNFQLASSTQRVPFGPSRLRPEVQNAIRLLRAMPPQARQERINSGRYSNFSPAERQLLTTATQSPQLN